MQPARSNGRRRPSRDPDRRPTHPSGFWPLPEGQALVVCSRCACPVPATDRAQQLHRAHHEQVDAGDPR
jgi:hypothetical protein